jgi:hypothetical protein
MIDSARDPNATLLRRTRLSVGGVAVGTALAVLIGRAAIARLGPPPFPGLLPEAITLRTLHLALIGVVVASFALRRGLGSRSALRDPATRPERFFAAHVAAAAVGSQIALLGIAAEAAFALSERELVPFWVAAAFCLALAFPRGYELSDLDEPRPAAEASSPPE